VVLLLNAVIRDCNYDTGSAPSPMNSTPQHTTNAAMPPPSPSTSTTAVAHSANAFWSVESRAWLLLGPFGSCGYFSFTPAEVLS
jgi:hypothetical protein